MSLTAFPVTLALFTISAVCWRVARDSGDKGRQTLLMLYLIFMITGIAVMLALPM